MNARSIIEAENPKSAFKQLIGACGICHRQVDSATMARFNAHNAQSTIKSQPVCAECDADLAREVEAFLKKNRGVSEAEGPKDAFRAIVGKSYGIKSIEIYGKRWFARSYGNTYFTAKIYVNGQLVHELPREYGYGDHYADRGFDWLDENGYTNRKTHSNGSKEAGWQYCQERGIEFKRSAQDVKRQRDL